MSTQKVSLSPELITTSNSELLRLDFKRSALQIYCAEFQKSFQITTAMRKFRTTLQRPDGIFSIHLWRKYCRFHDSS